MKPDEDGPMIRIPAAGLVVLLACAGAAFAATTVHGEVKSFDKLTHTLTLKNGHSYQLKKAVPVSGIASGSKVTLTIENGKITGLKFEGTK